MKDVCSMRRFLFIQALFVGFFFGGLSVTRGAEGLSREGWHIGHVDLHPHLEFTSAFNDNVLLQHDKQGDFSFITSPGLQLGYGQNPDSFVALDYTVGIERFLRLDSLDADNQYVKLDGKFEVHQLTIGFSHMFQDVRGPNTQIAARIHSRDNITHVDFEYRLSAKTSLGLGYYQALHDYLDPGFIDSQEYSPYLTIFYHMTPKLDLFCRFAYGWVDTDSASDSVYEQLDFGVRAKFTNKLTGTARIGYQHRTFSGGLSEMNALVAMAEMEAQLTKRTKLSVGLSRSVNPSPTAANNSYESTRLECKLACKLPGNKLSAWLGSSGEYAEYQYQFAGTTRRDLFLEGSTGVTYDATKKVQLSAEYLFWNNNTTLNAFGYTRNLISLHARVHF